ncbi:MAG: hypothetical protein QGI45_09250, partial [Myxococcota bacterium]|nr:hypothetical protein [Myxococcota bacterium]
MRWSHAIGICIIFALFACAGGENGGGCDSDYVYPDTPEAAPTHNAVRARITQQGINVFAESIPGFLAESCGDDGDLQGQCFLEPCGAGDDPRWLNFILERQEQSGVTIYSEAPLAAGESYTGECGPAYSSLGFELE